MKLVFSLTLLLSFAAGANETIVVPLDPPSECAKGDKECLQMEREHNMGEMLREVCNTYNQAQFELIKFTALEKRKHYLDGLEPAEEYEFNRLHNSIVKHTEQLKDIKARYEKRFKDKVTLKKCEEVAP